MAGYNSGEKNKLKIEEIKKRLIENGVEIPSNIEEYKNVDTKNLEFAWGTDSYRNAMRSNKHNGSSRYSNDELKEEVDKLGVKILNIEDFKFMKERNIKVECSKKHIYKTSISELKLGKRCPICASEELKKKNTKEITYRDNFKVIKEDTKNVVLECDCGFKWETTRSNYKLIVKNNLQNGMCVRCNNNSPKWETEVSYMLDELDVSYIKNYRGLGFEIDFFIKDKNIGIELNGNYWHSDIKKDRNYHFEKTKKSLENGIRLYSIFEYEYTKEKMFGFLKSILGKNDKRIYARECEIREVSYKESYDFLESNHFQGYGNSKIKKGLYYKDELVSVMTFSKSRYNASYDYEIIRFANKIGFSIVGGFSKLLSSFRKENHGSILSYCDEAKFNGDVYVKNGFELVAKNKIGFKWLLPNRKVESRNRSWGKMDIYKNYNKIYNCGTSTYILKEKE